MVPAITARLRTGLILFGAGLAASVQPEVPALASCAPAVVMTGGTAFGGSATSSLSADGRYLVFDSIGAVVPTDTNSLSDVFLFDRQTCLVERVSVTSAEEQAVGGHSSAGAISHDGRYIAFYSFASNLVGVPDALNVADVFVRDRHTGLTLHASPAFDGSLANGTSGPLAISGDGRFVAFWSEANNLIASDTNLQADLFVRDLVTASTTRVTVAPGGIESPGTELDTYFTPALSSDGRYVAFSSLKPDLVPGDTNADRDVFRRDLQTATTIRVSVATGGAEVFADSNRLAMSRDGRYVAFDSFANTLAASDPDNFADVFVHDVTSSATTHVSVDNRGGDVINAVSQEPAISGDGRYVAFASTGDLDFEFLDADREIFVRDLTIGRTRLVSVSEAGEPQDEDESASQPALSDDGAFVGFRSTDANLAPGTFGNAYVSHWWSVSAPRSINLLHNFSFSNGQIWWTPFAQPNASDLVWNTTGGVLQFYREPGSTQAVVFQATGAHLLPFAAIQANFQLRNTSLTRKRISVLIHDRDFSDLSVCTFWLDPNSPLQSYSMRTHTTRTWSDATLSFYAATPDGTGFYGVDNVALQYLPGLPDAGTDCVDPTSPPALGLAPGPNLVVNGDFGAALPPWATFGQIAGQIAGGVFEFLRPPGTPAGVVFQATGQAMSNNTMLAASFSLGNSSNVRKRVTVLVHDADFSDLSACTFWLPPQLSLTTYGMRLFTTKAWTNATISVYPATVGFEPWIRLDDVALRRVGSATGTTCVEPDLNARPAARPSSLAGAKAVSAPPNIERRRITVETDARPMSAGQALAPVVTLQFWLPPHDETIELEVTIDGETWTIVATFERSQDWTLVELDAPTAVQLRMRPAR